MWQYAPVLGAHKSAREIYKFFHTDMKDNQGRVRQWIQTEGRERYGSSQVVKAENRCAYVELDPNPEQRFPLFVASVAH